MNIVLEEESFGSEATAEASVLNDWLADEPLGSTTTDPVGGEVLEAAYADSKTKHESRPERRTHSMAEKRCIRLILSLSFYSLAIYK